jgi:CBS domain-containing protein
MVMPSSFESSPSAMSTGGLPRWLRAEYAWVGIGALALTLPWLLGRRGRRTGRKVKDVMVPDVVKVDAAATLREAAERMREANIGMLPVVEWGQVRGILTDRDLVVRGMARGVDPQITRVAECMSRSVVCAQPDWDIDDARRVMGEHRVGRLPVVDSHNQLLGIVTLGSLALRSPQEQETLDTAREVSRRSARA